MSTTTPAVAAPAFRHHLSPSRLVLAFGLLGAAGAVAHHHGIGLWTLAIGVIGPDLSFLAAIGAPSQGQGLLPRRAVRAYNAAHRPVGPLALAAGGVALGAPFASVVGLAWLAHQAWDRSLGYRLRDADGNIRA